MIAVSYPHWGNDDCTHGGDRTIQFLAVQVSLSTVIIVACLEEIYTCSHFFLAFHLLTYDASLASTATSRHDKLLLKIVRDIELSNKLQLSELTSGLTTYRSFMVNYFTE